MDPLKERPWYKKKRYIIPIGGALGIWALSLVGGSAPSATPSAIELNTASVVQTVTTQAQKTVPPAQTVQQSAASAHQDTGSINLSNDNHYINSAGNIVYPPANNLYTVTKVVDGDTIAISFNGESEIIRMIGIDTPETVDPRKPIQCFGKEASDKAKELLAGRKVRIEKDFSQGDRDKYGRLLGYVFRDDGFFINKYLIEQGYAHEYTYNLPYKYQSEFKAAQKVAESDGRGLWASGVCEEKPATSPNVPQQTQTFSPVQQLPTPSTDGYSCSANLYNCADFSTHAQAQAVYEMCGGVSNDIHRLDQDKDGEACESLP